MKRILFPLITFLFALLITFISGEILTRFLWKKPPDLTIDEKNLTYRFNDTLGWFPIPNSSKIFEGSRRIKVQHNKDGFRDNEHGEKTKRRIAFVGDSYVWGYDAEANERFTDKLQLFIPDWEVLNMGVSGYGNDQEFILLRKWFDVYKPDIVVLVFCDNDWEENNSNEAHMGYYKPYFESVAHSLFLKGVPVPKTLKYYYAEYPFLYKSKMLQLLMYSFINWNHPIVVSEINPTEKIISAIKRFTEQKGAVFKLAFIFNKDYERKKQMCCAAGTNYLFLGDNQLYTTGGWHWTPIGNDSVCAKFYRYLNL